MLNAYTNWLIKFRWTVILLSLVVISALIPGTRLLTTTDDYDVFFSDTNPQLLAFKAMEDTYTKNDNLLIMFEPADGDVFSAETLQAVHEFTELSWRSPHSIRVDSITNFQYNYAEEDDLIVENLVENPYDIDATDIAQIRNTALEQPDLVGRLLSPSGDVTAINISFELPKTKSDKVAYEIMDFFDPALDELKAKYPNISTYKIGLVAINKAIPDVILSDMTTLVPMAFGVILIGFIVLTRSLWGTLGSVVVMFASIGATMGIAGYMGTVITPISISAPTLILTLAVADCVHFLVTFFQQMRKGKEKNEAISHSIKLNLNPIFLTSATTAIGFLSMNFSDSPPFHDLGTLTAIGVLFAFVLSVTLLPALMAVAPVKQPKGGELRQSVMMDKIGNFTVNNYRKLLAITSITGIVLMALVPKNEIDDDFVKYFDESIEIRQHADHVLEKLAGMDFVDYSLDGKVENSVNKPDFLVKVERFEMWLKAQPEVDHVLSIVDTFRKLNKSMHGDDPAWYKLPESNELAAQYLLMYEMSLPFGLDLNNQISFDKSSTRLSVTLKNLTTKQILDFETRVNAWMQENIPEIATPSSSPTIMFSHIAKRNINSMLTGTIVALLLISVILVYSLKSMRYGFISLIPNLIPAGMAFGLWAIFNGVVGLSVAVVIAMTLGIVVDDTIHFLSKYIRAKREKGLDTEAAIRYTFRTVGEALFITTIILTGGFMILAQSSFSMNADMGLMTAMTICIALIVDFFLLPPLLIWMDKKRTNKAPEGQNNAIEDKLNLNLKTQ